MNNEWQEELKLGYRQWTICVIWVSLRRYMLEGHSRRGPTVLQRFHSRNAVGILSGNSIEVSVTGQQAKMREREVADVKDG